MALRAGISPGDRILNVNALPIRQVADYQSALARLAPDAYVALLVLRAPPEASRPALARGERRGSVLGLPANLVMALLAAAGFMCCVPMAMPQGHLVAF